MRLVRCRCDGRCAAPHVGRRPQDCPSGGVDAPGIRDWRVDRTTLVSMPSRRLRSVSILRDARAHIRTVAMRPVRCECDGRRASTLLCSTPCSLETAPQRSLNTQSSGDVWRHWRTLAWRTVTPFGAQIVDSVLFDPPGRVTDSAVMPSTRRSSFPTSRDHETDRQRPAGRNRAAATLWAWSRSNDGLRWLSWLVSPYSAWS